MFSMPVLSAGAAMAHVFGPGAMGTLPLTSGGPSHNRMSKHAKEQAC